ncbi:NAD(P)H-binding protein [Azoarcus olearius]|nr:NAD(P)H-binding protein [Azoarcus olearius]
MPQGIHPRMALVLGGTGSLGLATIKALLAHGWQVRALHRDPARAAAHPGMACPVEWVVGDAIRPEDVRHAARGASIIVHAVNPPRYQRWRELALPMLDASIEAASDSGARLVFPGNIYNYGPDAGTVIDEISAQHPRTRKGAVRVEMEERLADASRYNVRSLILRAGDFFGPHADSSWFGAMVKPGAALRGLTYPGRLDVGHAWAYLPDLAETLARLAAIEPSLPRLAVFHFEGHWLSGHGLSQAIRRVVGNPDLPVRRLPWPLLHAAAPFSRFVREMLEMRYLWTEALRLDNSKLVRTLGHEPHTGLDEALRTTLMSLGCLPALPAASRASFQLGTGT